MKEKILVTLGKDHIWKNNDKIISRSGEHKVTQIEITLDECLFDFWVYLKFTLPNGETFLTEKLDRVGNVVTYDIVNGLVSESGVLKVQAMLKKETGEDWESTIKFYIVEESIEAVDDIPNKDDFITEAQTLLNEIEEGLTPTIGENGNWFVGGKDTGKTSKGIQGEKGEKGDAGSVKFIIANELPNENIDESAIYMIPAGSTSEGNTYEEYIYVNGVWESLGSASVNVDLADYVKFDDHATFQKPGVVKAGYYLAIESGTGKTYAETLNYNTYNGAGNNSFIGKGTLENVLNARFVTLTQAEYDVLETKDENTYYYIVEE